MRLQACIVVVALVVLAACGTSSNRVGATRPPSDANVIVASFNFPESELLAELAAQALAAYGVPVRKELDLGTREMVLPALQQGLVDVVPEYVGSATAALDPNAARLPSDANAMRATLRGTLEQWNAQPLALAPAENVNGVVVTRDTARRFGLSTISDLSPVASSLKIGGPPECPARPYCLEGLRNLYGLNFKEFVPLSGEALVRRALEDRVIDAGVMFTTDGDLAQPELVLLRDDRRLQPPDNIVPVVRDEVVRRYGARVARTLDAVFTRLTTPMLRFLNWRVTVEGNAPAAEARGWLVRQGLVTLDGRAATAAS